MMHTVVIVEKLWIFLNLSFYWFFRPMCRRISQLKFSPVTCVQLRAHWRHPSLFSPLMVWRTKKASPHWPSTSIWSFLRTPRSVLRRWSLWVFLSPHIRSIKQYGSCSTPQKDVELFFFQVMSLNGGDAAQVIRGEMHFQRDPAAAY